MNPGTFFGELRRRNVYKVAATYAVIAWLLIEIASILLSSNGAPASVFTGFVVFLVLGFILALYISWAFEATPQGMKRTADVPPDAVLPAWSRRKFFTFIIVVGLLAAGLFVFDHLHNRTNPAALPPTAEP